MDVFLMSASLTATIDGTTFFADRKVISLMTQGGILSTWQFPSAAVSSIAPSATIVYEENLIANSADGDVPRVTSWETTHAAGYRYG
jgi:hypothetical protein